MKIIAIQSSSVIERIRQRRKYVVWSLTCILIMTTGFWWAKTKVEKAYAEAVCSQCIQNVYEIAMNLRLYKERHGHYPPAVVYDDEGKPMHSWRALISVYMEPVQSSYRFDEPWNGPNNRRLAEKEPSMFRCVLDGTASHSNTSYLAVCGPGTAFTDSEANGAEGPNGRLLVVEVMDSGVNWLEPRDLHVDAMSFIINDRTRPAIRGLHDKGATFVDENLEYGWIAPNTPPEVINSMITISKRGG